MLCQYTVENYKCIKDELTLDMQATTISEHSDSLLVDSDGAKFLPLAVIYGPNGSGKTTVLESLYSLACKVMRPICATTCDDAKCLERDMKLEIVPFLFTKKNNLPTKFDLFFRTRKNEYRYQLHLNGERVVYESLFKKGIEGYRYSEVFSRKANKIVLRGTFKNYNISGLSETLTLLSYFGITHRRNLIIKDIIEWIDTHLVIKNFGNPDVERRIGLPDDPKMKEVFLSMLNEMDIDIVDFRIEAIDEKSFKIYTIHEVDGMKYELELSEESSGTKKLFSLNMYFVLSMLKGRTLVVDELDAKIHPSMLIYLINMFRDPKRNKYNAQLIFTSHDLSTMTSEFLRRDEIWFIAKNNMQASQMYSLVEFKDPKGKTPRKDAAYNKQYIEGKYGADPYLQKIINWEEY